MSSHRSARFLPSPFGDLKLLTLPSHRVVKAQKVVVNERGTVMVLGSQGQVYVKGSFDNSVIRPGDQGRALAHGLLLLGLIDVMASSAYNKLCAVTEQHRELRRAAIELDDAADILGLKLTAEQQKRVEELS